MLLQELETDINRSHGVYDSYYNAYVYLPEDHCLFGYDYQNIGDHGYGFISHPLSYSAFNTKRKQWVLGITGDYIHSMFGLDSEPIQTMEGIKEKLNELVSKLVEVQELYKQSLYTPPVLSETSLKYIAFVKSKGYIPDFVAEAPLPEGETHA